MNIEKKLKLLIIGAIWPEPSSSGMGLRMTQYMQLFRQYGWSVTFACTSSRSEYMLNLDALGVASVAVQVNDHRFDAFVGELQPDVVLFDRFSMEEQFGWRVETVCPQALRIIETIDLHCLRQARHMRFKATAEVVQDVQNIDLYNDVAQREIAAIYRSDLSILTSDYEMALLQERFLMRPAIIHHCPFMFDKQHIFSDSPDFAQRQHFMTIGNFRHAPNWDAVLWLKQSIWPLIRARLPQVELRIYGSYAPPKAMALHHPASGFHVLGRADSVDIVMQQARVCLAPLRFGAGIKTKLADAMRNGTPSVTTHVGAEGMSGGLTWGGTITNNARAFADAAVALYQQREAWQKAQAYGFDIVQTQFDMQANGASLIDRIYNILTHIKQHRLDNFHGTMLRHHQHRSTEFMSRWIEVKNMQRN